MRKLIFILVTLPSLLLSCHSQVHFTTAEEITIVLPKWPPASGNAESYPPLCKWILQVDGKEYLELVEAGSEGNFAGGEKIIDLEGPFAEGEKIIDLEGNFAGGEQLSIFQSQFSLTFTKNLPSSITALPITLNAQNEQVTFFKPAGGIYPYDCKNQKLELTWEHGFSAVLMEQLYQSSQKSGYKKETAMDYIATYNWKKLNESIDAKIQKSFEEESFFYNPWLLDTQTVLEGIAYNNFSATKLNLTSSIAFAYSFEEELKVLSSFIPENGFIKENNQVTIKKNEVNFFSLSQTYGIIITGNSAKNVLLEYIYLPIYIKDI